MNGISATERKYLAYTLWDLYKIYFLKLEAQP